MEAPLPLSLKETAAKARVSYIAYEGLFNVLNADDLLKEGLLAKLLGYGDGPF